MKRIDFLASEWIAAGATALLLVFSFPNFELYPLAWIALVPLLVAIARRPSPLRAFVLGWAAGSAFFYATCYWLTYSMIHYGGLSPLLSYVLLIPGAVVIGIFPGLFAWFIALAIRKWGHGTLLLAPIFWSAFEWVRLGVTGQLWNALGYSQAYHPNLIQAATWGGVYAVSFLIVAINSAIALLIVNHTQKAVIAGFLTPLLVLLIIATSPMREFGLYEPDALPVSVVALQPNVPMTLAKSDDEMKELLDRHISLSEQGLQNRPEAVPSLVVWPESPMNFTYASDQTFQQQLATFTIKNHTSLLFNSLEPTLTNGFYNSALLINDRGRMIAQYDKIRLLPFGEYVPLPQWLPGASLITGLVGDFTPGDKYTLMPFGEHRAGTFICIESAYPSIARRLTSEGADVLINISNDGYLGPTAVMRQHLANAIFRAVENGRPVLRVTNTGLTANIDAHGRIENLAPSFQADVRVWQVRPSSIASTFYTRHGDLFVYLCTAITVLVFFAILATKRRSFRQAR